MAMFYGKVSDVKDPDKLGRIKVSLDCLGKDTISDWLPMLALQAGKESGFFVMPDVDDQVVVAYMDANHQHGVVLGGIWTPDNKPPKTEENSDSDLNADGKNNLKFYRSKSGLRFIFDDTKGKEKIQILSKDAKTRFEFDADKKLLNIETDQGITIKAKKKIAIEAEEMTIKTDKATSLDSGGMSLKSSKGLKAEASNDLSAEGSSVKLN
jgi:phage baseplate assembly protein gpV